MHLPTKITKKLTGSNNKLISQEASKRRREECKQDFTGEIILSNLFSNDFKWLFLCLSINLHVFSPNLCLCFFTFSIVLFPLALSLCTSGFLLYSYPLLPTVVDCIYSNLTKANESISAHTSVGNCYWCYCGSVNGLIYRSNSGLSLEWMY